MTSLTIPCPECGAGLKLPDRSLLGRRGKCPKCQHRFVLEEPDEVQLELAEPDPPPRAPVASSPPMVGTSPRWVPDDPAEQEAGDADFPVLPSVDARPVSGRSRKTRSSASVPTADAFAELSGAVVDSAPASVKNPSTHELDFAQPASGVTAIDTEAASPGPVIQRVRGRRKSGSRTGPVVVVIGILLFAASMYGLWRQKQIQDAEAARLAAEAAKPKVNQEWQEQKQDMAASFEDVRGLSPTSGEPIPLSYLPFTPHLVFHIRPAEIWSADVRHQEFVGTLGGLGVWLKDSIQDISRFQVEEIQEITFALNFGARTSAPEVSAVVRLKAEQPPSAYREKLGGRLRPDLNKDVYEAAPWAYRPVDAKTFVVADVLLAPDLVDADEYPRDLSVDLAGQHRVSDRTREMTLLFDLANVDTHREYIFGTSMQQFADSFVLWFGRDVRTVSWSFHLAKDFLFMETLLKPSGESSALQVQRHVAAQMEKLPGELQDLFRMMKPGTLGRRTMVGRLPAMMQALNLGTSFHTDQSLVRMVTILPDKAAANLAIASLYAWNESLVTDFTVAAPVVSAASKIPDLVADRLKMPILIDFRQTALDDVFRYISEEIKTPITLNGPAFKLSGLTQNESQTMNLGELPAVAAFDAIFSKYKGTMVMVVDETAKTIEVTTRPVATEAGQTIFETKQ
ncbi:MAG: hypothetical protein R3C49_22330 [Planctomycetaceae bacterium]